MPAKGQFKYDWLRVLDEIDARKETTRAAALRLGVSSVSITLNRQRLGRPRPATHEIDWPAELRIAEKNQETIEECANRLRRSISVVYVRSRRAGFQFYRPNRASENHRRDLVLEWLRVGHSPHEIASKLGISKQRVSQIILKYEAKHGVEFPRSRQPARQQPNSPFYHWRMRLSFTRLKAGVALGVGAQRIARWDQGEPTPLSVRLAMAALEHGILPSDEQEEPVG